MAIEIGALTTTAISQSRAEKIPVSGAGDPCVTIETLGRAIMGGTIVKVEYASASNQSATIQAAIDAATAGDTLVFGMGVVKVETQLLVTKRINIVCFGTNFTTSSNIIIWRFGSGATYATISGCVLTGSGEDSGSTTQCGINNSGSLGMKISNVHATGLGGYGFQFANDAAASYETCLVDQCSALNCNIGMEVAGSYISIDNCSANSCNVGIDVTGSNYELTNCDANICDTAGIRFTGVGKGKIIGGNYNHNAGYGLHVVSLQTDGIIRFIGTSVLANTTDITVANSNAQVISIFFIGCHLDSGMAFDASTALRVTLIGNIFNSNAPDSGDTTNVTYVNNYTETGTLYAG